MIMPCNSANGCGTVSVRSNQLDDLAYRPIDGISYEQMTGFMPSSSATASAAPVPGTSNIPTASGVAAAQGLDLDNPAMPGGANNLRPSTGGSSVQPEGVLPNAPEFQVPNNPLLPPGYQEVINYENLQYMNGFLRTQIGKYIRVEQIVGSTVIEDRYGYLVGVGLNYILLQEINTQNIMAVDFYNIKYVYIYYSQPTLPTNATR